MKISIIIPSFQRDEELEANIFFWRAELQNLNHQILIANASNYRQLKTKFCLDKNIHFLDVPEDYWWSESVNFAIGKAVEIGSEFVLITNDDMRYPKGILSLFQKYADPNEVLTIPQLQTDGNLYYGALVKGFFKEFVSINKIDDESESIDVTNGSCLFIPISTLTKIGFFNTNELPHYYSDIEFLIRLKEHNFKLRILKFNPIIQGPPTEFYRKFSYLNILYHKGSPLNFRAVCYFGLKLYKNYLNLFFLRGLKYSSNYLLNIFKFHFKKFIKTLRFFND